jgi:hypothetical protein
MGAKSAVLGSPAQQHFSLNPLCVRGRVTFARAYGRLTPKAIASRSEKTLGVGGMVASDCADRRLTPKAIACALRLRETLRMAHPLSRGVGG